MDPASDPRILPDMGVKVTFLDEEDKPKANAKGKPEEPAFVAMVPQAAIRNDGATKYVFVVNNGSLQRHAVTVGPARGSDVEILAGIQPGAQVVVKGPEGLSDGQAVQLKQ
jgi:multidrug efflux pump subunit AcrA (membrane-fusion protein)